MTSVDTRLQHRFFSYIAALIFLVVRAGSRSERDGKLAIFANRMEEGSDTIYHTIADFQVVGQDSNIVTQDTFRDKIYVADFFFTSCRTICPIMKTQMLRVYDSIKS